MNNTGWIASAVLNLNSGRTGVSPVSAVFHHRSACKQLTTGFIAGRLQAGTANQERPAARRHHYGGGQSSGQRRSDSSCSTGV